jgi:hypothetical protein
MFVMNELLMLAAGRARAVIRQVRRNQVVVMEKRREVGREGGERED